jgi:hypothetical protein
LLYIHICRFSFLCSSFLSTSSSCSPLLHLFAYFSTSLSHLSIIFYFYPSSFSCSSSALSQEIDELNEQCKGANAELHVLQSEASLMFKRLAAASKLIDGEDVDCIGMICDGEDESG